MTSNGNPSHIHAQSMLSGQPRPANVGTRDHTFTLSRIEDQFGVLISAENLVLEIPTALLPGEAHSGQIFKFKIERCESLEHQRKNELVSL